MDESTRFYYKHVELLLKLYYNGKPLLDADVSRSRLLLTALLFRKNQWPRREAADKRPFLPS